MKRKTHDGHGDKGVDVQLGREEIDFVPGPRFFSLWTGTGGRRARLPRYTVASTNINLPQKGAAVLLLLLYKNALQ